MKNLREALEARGASTEVITEAVDAVEAFKTAGYNDTTINALCEAYLGEGTTIKGEFTLEKLMMSIDEDKVFLEFWEGAHA